MTGFNRHILNKFIWFVTTVFAYLLFSSSVYAADDMVGSVLNISKPEVFSFSKKQKSNKISNFPDFAETEKISKNNYLVSSVKAAEVSRNRKKLSNTLNKNSALRMKIAKLKNQLSIRESLYANEEVAEGDGGYDYTNEFKDYSDEIIAEEDNNEFRDYSDEVISEEDENPFKDYSEEEFVDENNSNPFKDHTQDEFAEEETNPVSLEDVFSKIAIQKTADKPLTNRVQEERLTFKKENNFFNKPLPSYKDTYLDMGTKKQPTKFNVKGELQRSFLSQNKYIAPLEISEQNNNDDWGKKDEEFKSSSSQRARSENILQLKIKFKPNSSAISSHNLNILRAFAHTVLDKPYQGIQVSISEDVMSNRLDKVLAAKQFAITSKILREEGISEEQIIPVLTDRSMGSLALNIVSTDSFKNKKVSSGVDIFGQEKDIRSFRMMNW